jgi:hypothetical protein
MKYLIYLIIFTAIISGCKKNKLATDINSNIIIELQETATEKALIRATTSELYSCANYSIEFSKRKIGSNIIISFKHVNKSDVCLTAFGHAQSSIDLDDLDKNEYNLKFKLNGKVTKGTLTMNPYKIELENSDNIELK